MIQVNTGDSLTCRKININDLVKKAKREFIKQFIKSNIDISGQEIKLVTSKTRFGGNRLWFVCPTCFTRVGVVYKTKTLLGCNSCMTKARSFLL